MNIKRRRVFKTVVMAGIVGASASLGLQGCGDMMSKLGPVGTLVENQLGMKLSFKLAGAPSDEILQVFWYADKTNLMMGGLEKQGRALSAEFARTFNIKVNTLTDEGLAELAEESSNIDPDTMTDEQKQWIERNLPMMGGWAYAAAGTATSAGTFALAIPQAINKGKENLTDTIQVAIERGPKLASDVESALSKIEPVVDSVGQVVKSAMALGKATGVNPPTPEEDRKNANKVADSTLPAGSNADFA